MTSPERERYIYTTFTVLVVTSAQRFINYTTIGSLKCTSLSPYLGTKSNIMGFVNLAPYKTLDPINYGQAQLISIAG